MINRLGKVRLLLFLEIVGIDPLHFVCCGRRHSDPVIDHQLCQFVAVDEHQLAVPQASRVIRGLFRELRRGDEDALGRAMPGEGPLKLLQEPPRAL